MQQLRRRLRITVRMPAVGERGQRGGDEVRELVATVAIALRVGARASGIGERGLLQLVALVLGVVLLIPAMLVTGRALGRTPRDDPRYLDLQLRQNWYAAAALSWAGALIVGILFAWLVLAVL
ncbi:hypothetical protein Mlaev_01631 [Microbacterium laevaniformans]|uniref:Uncharacterized protein n=1 Tax=Microbacterium laevaniformans TaxID=36807 RepID=A0A150HFZ5_9MICO|nr:hypothetical protein Mlaev_01631 [Microbacterium laevaniformans]